MIDESEVLDEAVSRMSRDFELSGAGHRGPDLPTPDDFEARLERVRDLIASRLEKMGRYQREKLFAALYRIDVSESKVQRIFADHPDDWSTPLATLIVERQMDKARSRLRFRDSDPDSPPPYDAKPV